MSDDFATIKAALNLRTIITSQTGFSVNSAGHLDECPFCSGKDCFSIPKDRDGYRCFQCDKTGDVFIFLEDFHHIDKAEALKMAAGLANIPLTEKKGKGQKLSVTDKIRLAAADYYHGNLAQGQAYFDRRGHLPATLEREKVGVCDGHLLDHLRTLGFLDK
jgi:DNA primase